MAIFLGGVRCPIAFRRFGLLRKAMGQSLSHHIRKLSKMEDEGSDTGSEKAGENSSEGNAREETEKTAALAEREAGEDASLSSGGSSSSPPKKGGWIPPIKKHFSQDAWLGRKPDLEYSKMPLEEKRKHYACGEDYVTISSVPTWSEFHKSLEYPEDLSELHYAVDLDLNKKVSLWRGDITQLEIDAIVNAANHTLLGGGGVDGAIHRAAGRGLLRECETLGGCDTGDAKLSGGHRLPAKYVLHTVGPMDSNPMKLQCCYERCLELTLQHNIRSVAFPCIATGIYGFPHKAAAQIALKVTREWLEKHRDKVDRIIFCVFQKVDYKFYCEYFHYFYPVEKCPPQPHEKKKAAKESEKEVFRPPLKSSISAPPATGSKRLKESSEEVPAPESTVTSTDMETGEDTQCATSAPGPDTGVSDKGREEDGGTHERDQETNDCGEKDVVETTASS